MNKKTVRDLEVKGKKVVCRVHFNVPLDIGEITDATRIKAALPAIEHVSKHVAIVIRASHLGRPEGEVLVELRLDSVAERLSNLVGKNVIKTDAVYGKEA